jgi:SsrA-binding protein
MVKVETKDDEHLVAENRKALHDYHILESFEAGIALLGTEVKGIREGKANLRDSYARVEHGEVWLYNVHINPYSHRGYADHEPTRRRKLLLHREQIRKLVGKTTEKGLTLVPTRLYFKRGRVKVTLALARGKQLHDKRETICQDSADTANGSPTSSGAKPNCVGSSRRRVPRCVRRSGRAALRRRCCAMRRERRGASSQ